MKHHLDTASKLRLRQRFNRWMKSPGVFAGEIADAQKQIELAEQEGWSMSIDRFGIPTALPPANLRLTAREQKRFQARLSTMTDEAEIKRTMAALSAAGYRGFQLSVSASGKLQAKPPGAKATRIIHGDNLSSTKQKKFYNRFFPSTVTAKA